MRNVLLGITFATVMVVAYASWGNGRCCSVFVQGHS
jgi:hypothetical protein